MGNCQTNNAAQPEREIQDDAMKGQSPASSTHVVTEELGHSHEATTPGENTVDSDSTNVKPREPEATEPNRTDPNANAQWTENPGYSSGASSAELTELVVSTSTISIERDQGSGRLADPLRLESMRNLMHANGDLTQAVVRLETPFGKPIEEIYEGVHNGPFLGEGVAGVVRKVKHRATGVEYACKVLDIGLVQTEDGLRQLRNEISIMCQLDHPNIVRIEEVYESTNTIYLLQELCLGGDLYDRLDEQPDLHYTEAHCAKLIKNIVSSVRYLHSKGVIHRDLKLENFLFSSTAPDSELKMIDFGLSKHFDLGEVQHEQVGTPYTCAPEILKGSYDEKCDIWAVGVITYLLLSGETPFGGCYENECMEDVRRNILNGSFAFEPEDIWENTSELSKKFVKRLLNVDPTMRPTAKEVQRDEWLQVYARKSDSCEDNKLNPRIVDALVNFKEYSSMRRLLHEVLSFTLLPEQIVELREEFQKIDSDNDGEISLEAMKAVLIPPSGGGALGGLTEAEVEDIFDALKVNKNDSTIRWHEFIAAGLSQCQVDDRNLRLCFDRLDTDRKGYIGFDDLTDLLGHSVDTLESVQKMWQESMSQCRCKQDRIAYDDFLLLMKGQTRRESYRPSMVWSPQHALVRPADQAVLEELYESGSIDDNSRQAKGETSKAVLGREGEDPFKSRYLRKRSKSFDDITLDSDISSLDEPQLRRGSLPTPYTPTAHKTRRYSNEGKTPLLATREQYQKHRDLRIALLEASKHFDDIRQARRAEKHDQTLGSPLEGAGLIMKRGSMAPQDLEELHQRALFDAAVHRSGREPHAKHVKAGHRKKKTQSDITGMMLSPAHE